MNEVERKEAASKLFHDIQNIVTNLFERWMDEKEYENIDDYSIHLKKEVEKIGGIFIKMNKKPFGFIYKLSDATYQIYMKTAGQYGYKRIG